MKIVTRYDDNAKKPIAELANGTVILYANKHLVKTEQDGYYLSLEGVTSENDAHAIRELTEMIEGYLFYCLDNHTLTTIEGWRTDYKELSATITLENKD